MSESGDTPQRRRINVTTQVGEIPAGGRFNPQQFSRERTTPKPASMEDLAAAFAKAGQPAPQIRSAPDNTKRSGQAIKNTEIPEPPDPILSEREELTNVRVTGQIDSDNPFATREALPSNEIFYKYPELILAPLEVPQYAQLYKARKENDESALIDVIGAATNIDIRDLTVKDFRYLMYKLRIISSVRAPYKLSYTSIYGNRNEFSINTTNLSVKILQDVTAEEYESYLERGFTMPTMRDQEEFNGLQRRLGNTGEFLWSHAKYIAGSDVNNKITNLRELPKKLGILAADLFADIDYFANKFENYGVTESVDLTDKHFNASKAIEKLSTEIANTDQLLINQTLSVALVNNLVNRRKELVDDMARIEAEIANTGEAAPKRETIEFSIEIADFFPVI